MNESNSDKCDGYDDDNVTMLTSTNLFFYSIYRSNSGKYAIFEILLIDELPLNTTNLKSKPTFPCRIHFLENNNRFDPALDSTKNKNEI